MTYPQPRFTATAMCQHVGTIGVGVPALTIRQMQAPMHAPPLPLTGFSG